MDLKYNNGLHIYNFKKYDTCIMVDMNDCNNIDNMKKVVMDNINVQVICYTNFSITDLELIKSKIDAFEKILNANIIFYFTTEFNKYTKPFATILNDLNNVICFYGTNEINFKFALNCNIKFMNLETLQIDDLKNRQINYPISIKNNFTFELNNICGKNLILLVGYPASGKSFLAKYIANKYDYFILSLDDHLLKKNRMNILDFENIITKYNNVIVDYCCLKPIRKKFINIGKKYNYHIISICIDCDINLLKHNSYYRYLKYDREIAKSVYDLNLQLGCDYGEGIDEMIKLDNIIVTNNDEYYKYMY